MNIDIVIPTHNRSDLLRRVLDYYSNNGKEFNFIIADSSSLQNKARNKKLISTYPKLKILYIDKFSENLQQHIKFAKMVKYVKSKYVCFCADDDFIVPNGIKECVNFLDKNPDYAAAHGSYIGFYLFKYLGYKSFWWNFRYSHQSISDSSSEKRLASHLSNFTLVMWAVRRTSLVKACYKELLKANFDPFLLLMYGELLPDVLTVIYGKVKRLKTFYAARQYFFSIATNYKTLIDAINTKKYDQEYIKFRDSLVNNLIKKNFVPKNEAVKIIDSAMDKYLKYSYQEYLVNRLNRSLRHFPKFILKGFRLLHARYLLSKDKKDQIGLIDNPSSKYFNDFEAIRHFVLK